MEEDGLVNFKALRAKFQEEALLAQTKTSRPAVAEKPKRLPPPGGHCSSVVSGINIVVDNKTPVVPRVLFRDGLRASGGKRPISFPHQPQQTSPPSEFANGDNTTRHFLKDRHMPLVLPALPVKDQKMEPPAEKEHKLESEPGKEAFPQTRMKKKGLLLPFKSVKPSKVSGENGDEPTYADLTNRPCSAPSELPSVGKKSADDCVSLKSDQSATEYSLSSPNVTPPFTESHADSDNSNLGSLEKAKRKFSQRQISISAKPQCVRSPNYTCRDEAFPLPPKNPDSICVNTPVHPPVCLPHLACISARPFFKASNSAHKPAFDMQLLRNKAERSSFKTFEPHPPSIPLKKPLLDLRTLGPLPTKPPRPHSVDLSRFYALAEVSPGGGQTPSEKQQSELPSISNPALDAPEFPDVENSEMETAEDEVVHIAALELEASDVVCADLNTPVESEPTNVETPKPDLSVCDPAETSKSCIVQDLNLGSENIIPLDPPSFPEPINLSQFPELSAPEQWSHCEEAAADSFLDSHFDETDVGPAESRSIPEETELSSHATSNDDIPTHLCVYQHDSYYETCDNLYEDVENINKFISGQVSTKRKGSLKNPYADNHRMKEEPCLNKWPRNPCKAHSSPNTAEHREQRKKEKQRLEKERKEQKEKEKKENEMKKKFKVTGEEEPMYHARVMVASKVRKNDLPVKSGDTVSIIRTTNCPKGKWLARDANHKYGYISVMNVELNIKEMLELGKKAQAAGRGGNLEADTVSIGSRSSSHPVLTSSFTDDSEEWACEDETLSQFNESSFPQQTASAPEMSCVHVGAQHTLSDANLEDLHTQTRHEALQKLAFFFQHNKDEFDVPDGGGATPTNAETSNFLCAVEEPPYPEQEVDFTELELLPPPPLYADNF
ncbi:uncharacterized protein si:ch211-188c16.1 isoform X2 [Melanotaenia boesemani]|uniref:uncharacterized protein si:ch211-188c16.1 isoform X2 n=1 Tax=Melanotaenia boesemani TaxID=1250792 RepID=UPI001C05BB22|nr:uncharacterized protein si:ch211-188c16.1 isoform X2 [Melanotaenia boesemani]